MTPTLTNKSLKLVVAVAAVVAALFVAFILLSATTTIKWVGHTDLVIRFYVTDEATGAPIEDATVHIRAEPGGFCEERAARQFVLVTDECGQAKYICKNCMCFGSRGTFEDTFAVHLPYWWFHVTTPGHTATEPEYLDVIERARQVHRGDQCATLDVKISLRKAAANNG